MNKILFSLLLLGVLAGCGGLGKNDEQPTLMSSTNADKLHGKQWELQTIMDDQTRVILHPDSHMSIAFGADGQVVGFAGVNRFSGRYQISETGELSWAGAGFITTRKAGPPELMEKEQAFLKALAKTNRAIVGNKALQLQSDDSTTVIGFTLPGA